MPATLRVTRRRSTSFFLEFPGVLPGTFLPALSPLEGEERSLEGEFRSALPLPVELPSESSRTMTLRCFFTGELPACTRADSDEISAMTSAYLGQRSPRVSGVETCRGIASADTAGWWPHIGQRRLTRLCSINGLHIFVHRRLKMHSGGAHQNE